jgi:DNA-binding NarL/FixJ family response regulator
MIIDDDPFTRVTLANTITSLGYEITAECESATTALQSAEANCPDIAIVDLDLGEGPSGIDVTRGLRRINPSIGIMILSTYADPRLMGQHQAELPADAVYVVKQSVTGPEVLERALLLAFTRETVSSASLVAQANESPVASLSDQQVEVMRLIATGASNAEIARRRFISEASVEKAIARLIKQLDLKATKDQNQRVMITQHYFKMTGTRGGNRS